MKTQIHETSPEFSEQAMTNIFNTPAYWAGRHKDDYKPPAGRNIGKQNIMGR